MNRCLCDQFAWIQGRPFCGYCGGQLSAPPFYLASGELLWPDMPAGKDIDDTVNPAVLEFTLGPLPKQRQGWIDPVLLLEHGNSLRMLSGVLHADGVQQQSAVRAEGATVTVSLARNLLQQSRSVVLTLELALKGAACSSYRVTIPLRTGSRIELESSDPRFQLSDGHYQLLALQTTVENSAAIAPIKLKVFSSAGTLETVAQARLRFPGGRPDSVLPPVNVLACGQVEITLPCPLLAELSQAEDAVFPLQLVLAHANGISSVLALEVHRVALPVIEFEQPVRFEFRLEESDNWCSEGDSKTLRVRRAANWSVDFELGVSPCGNPEVAGAVELFRAEVLRENEQQPNSIREVRLTAVINPAWLYRTRAHEKSWHEEAEIKFSLRNRANTTGPQSSTVELAVAKISIRGCARAPLVSVGLDFGTCNTSAALLSSEDQLFGEPLAFHEGTTVPTLLYYLPPVMPITAECVSEQLRIGFEAQSEDNARRQEVLFRRALKSTLLENASGEQQDPKVPLSSECAYDGAEMIEHFLMAYLQRLVRTRKLDGRMVQTLVFTYPAESPESYRARLRELLQRAAHRVKLPFFIELQPACDEASAGGLWWFVKNGEKFQDLNRVTLLVYDYGGGTTDISALEFLRAEGGEDHWTVRVLGVAGVQRCGGDDLTWRLAREFSRSISRGCREEEHVMPFKLSSPFVQKLITLESLEGRREWWNNAPELVKLMDQYKPDTVGAKTITNLPEAVLADLIEDKNSVFIGKEVKVHAKTFRPEPGRTPTGQYALHVFDGWQVSGKELRPRTSGANGGLLGDYAWAFDLSAAEDGPLAEPETALQIARNMIVNLFAVGGKVDHLLLIGQASQTVYFVERLKAALQDCYGDLPAIHSDAKVCVAAGACSYHKYKTFDSINLIPTIHKRVVALPPSGPTQTHPRVVELLKSSTECNALVKLDIAKVRCLAAPVKVSFYVDSLYSDELNKGQNRNLQRKMPPLREGYLQAAGVINLMVTDPDEPSYNAAHVPPEIRAMIETLRAPQGDAGWYFCFWPEGRPGEAWIFKMRI